MDPALITPFIASVQHVFATMMQVQVTVGDPQIRTSPTATFDVSGIIGMSGDVIGSVVLSFPKATAQRLVALFAGQECAPDHPDFADAIGELTNMLSGSAKGMFQGKKKVQISCPSVVIGPQHVVARPKDVPCIAIPCSTDCGEFVMEIAVSQAMTSAPAAATTAAAKV